MNGRLLPRDQLTDSLRSAMLAMLQKNFLGVTKQQFVQDLESKNWVILIEDDARQLCGFSTLLLYNALSDGDPIRVIYSGDTIVNPAAWGSSALARTWLESVRSWLLESAAPLYWLLISSGFRTYRFLPVFWREFWPRYDVPTPLAMQRQLDCLAAERFGGGYDNYRGLVRLGAPQVLRNGLMEIPANRLSDPHVEFFARANPGHAAGDELVCLCPLTAANQTAVGRKLVKL